jgi:GDPmannose 4,6-dehydratase
LQQPTPDDYVVATGVSHSVKDLVQVAFAHAGLDWNKYVDVDPLFLRPAEVDHLIGNAAKARQILGWTPSVDFSGLIGMMVESDIERLSGIKPAKPR